MNKIFANWLITRAQLAVAQRPGDVAAWTKLYSRHLDGNDANGFLTFSKDFIRRHPENQSAWKFLRMAGEGVIPAAEALRFAQEVVRLHPASERAWSQLDAEVEADAGFCREILKAHPGNPPATSRLMRALKQEGKHADLVALCVEAVRLRPDPSTWVTLAEASSALGKFDDAIPAYEKALQLKPDNLIAINGLGCVFHNLGRYDDAIAMFQRAIKLRKDDATPWTWLAMAYMQTGDVPKARDAIAKVKATLPLVAQMLSEQLATLPGAQAQVADPRVAVDGVARQTPR